ncbi:MAG TPA: hypothetical protein VGK19_09335 [Capsulimonadaceae bacterium]|jgi:Spy/CpxP family protein refolding chaperone
MKKLATFTASIVALGLIGFAPSAKAEDTAPPAGAHQDARGQKPGAGQKHDPLAQFASLNLTDDQKAKIRAIFDAAKAQVQPIEQDTTLTPDQKREKTQPIRKQAMQDALAVLTDAQRAQFKAERGGPKGGGPLADLAYLNLTADQNAQLEKIKADAKTQFEAVRGDASLTEDQKKEKGHQIMETATKAFIAILTPDQAKLFREHHQPQNGGQPHGDQPAKP